MVHAYITKYALSSGPIFWGPIVATSTVMYIHLLLFMHGYHESKRFTLSDHLKGVAGIFTFKLHTHHHPIDNTTFMFSFLSLDLDCYVVLYRVEKQPRLMIVSFNEHV